MRYKTLILLTSAAFAIALGLLPALITHLAEHALLKFRSGGALRITKTEGVEGFIIGVKASAIHGFAPFKLELGNIKSIPLQFQIGSPLVSISPRISPPWLNLNFNAQAYDGAIKGALTGVSANGMLSLVATGINLSKHPQVRSFGVLSGLLGFELVKHPLDLDWLESATYKIELRELDIELPGIVSGLVKGLNSLKRGDLSVSASIAKGGVLILKGGRFSSSLGVLELNAEGIIEKSAQIRELKANINFNLIGEDSNKLIPWLPIITNGAISGERRNFSAKIRSVGCGAPNALKMSLGVCVKINW